MEEILAKITDFGDKAHGDQRRKYSPDRYMVHPVRVMQTCGKYTDDISVLAAALLHDVLEDTPVTAGEIERFLNGLINAEETQRALGLIIDLTDVYTKEAYPKLNRRARKSKEVERLSKIRQDAQTVKYADIIDNSSEIVSSDPSFARVFLMEARAILQKMDSGNPELYKIAVETVNNALKAVDRNKY